MRLARLEGECAVPEARFGVVGRVDTVVIGTERRRAGNAEPDGQRLVQVAVAGANEGKLAPVRPILRSVGIGGEHADPPGVRRSRFLAGIKNGHDGRGGAGQNILAFAAVQKRNRNGFVVFQKQIAQGVDGQIDIFLTVRELDVADACRRIIDAAELEIVAENGRRRGRVEPEPDPERTLGAVTINADMAHLAFVGVLCGIDPDGLRFVIVGNLDQGGQGTGNEIAGSIALGALVQPDQDRFGILDGGIVVHGNRDVDVMLADFKRDGCDVRAVRHVGESGKILARNGTAGIRIVLEIDGQRPIRLIAIEPDIAVLNAFLTVLDGIDADGRLDVVVRDRDDGLEMVAEIVFTHAGSQNDTDRFVSFDFRVIRDDDRDIDVLLTGLERDRTVPTAVVHAGKGHKVHTRRGRTSGNVQDIPDRQIGIRFIPAEPEIPVLTAFSGVLYGIEPYGRLVVVIDEGKCPVGPCRINAVDRIDSGYIGIARHDCNRHLLAILEQTVVDDPNRDVDEILPLFERNEIQTGRRRTHHDVFEILAHHGRRGFVELEIDP